VKEIFYDWGGANLWLFHLINNVRGGWLDAAMQFASWLGDHERFAVYVALIAVVALFRAGRGEAAEPQPAAWLGVLAVFSLAYLADAVVVSYLKAALDFPRPAAALPADALFVVGEVQRHHSLPSGHATFAMTLAASLWPLLGRASRAAMALFVVWVCLSRISLGAHFPADVVAGLLLASAVVLPLRRIAARFTR
jgi:membrane-associated phospholipid phosphatase